MKKIILSLTATLASILSFSQERIFTKSASISFFSKTTMENIEAHNNNAVTVLDKATGQVEFSVLMKGFEFQKELMQEHFNENYVESDKYPKGVFKGKINDPALVDFTKDGEYKTTTTGILSIHGETKAITAPVIFIVTNGTITASSEFTIVLSDYKISIPSLVKDKIEGKIKIKVVSRYLPVKIK